MADQKAPQMQATLGLTGLTSNAMALIAPGAFLWLTFFIQATTGTTAPAMWLGIFGALLLCLATAVSYAEISKLYPGTGSSYYYAEQALLSQDKMFKYARIAKFVVGWGSHLYYWVYPGVMVATTGIFCGYVVGFLYPNVMSGSNPGPLFMAIVAVVFSIFVGWIASKGAGASTAVNLAINVIQISALVVFSVLAIGYRASHPAGSAAFQYDGQSLATYTYQFATAKDGSIVRDSAGNPLPLLDSAGKPVPFTIDYPEKDSSGNFLSHPNAMSVISPHKFSYLFIQATVAILILVGFESVTSMGGEAKEPNQAYSHRRHCLAADTRSGLLSDRVFRSQLLSQFGIFDANGGQLGCSHRRHDDYRRRRAAGSGTRQVLHARRSYHGLPGLDRHHAELHEHWRPRDLCNGQGRRGSRALRHSSC